MRLLAFIFIIFGLAVFLGSHYILYFSTVRFYGIVNPIYRKILLSIFLFLSASFIISSILLAISSGAAAHAFYILSSWWIALAINLLIAAMAGWLIYWVTKYFSAVPPMSLIASLLIAVSLGAVAYGGWNAQNPRIINLTVKIKNLPPAWQDKTIVQLSDVHAGAINKREFIEKIINILEPIKKDLVVITGDFFDSRDGSFENLAAPLKNIGSTQGVYFVSGNHERYIGEDKAYAALESAGVIVLQNKIINIDGLNLAGIDYPGEMQPVQAELVLRQLNPDNANVLLYHEPRLIDLAKKYGVDLQLAGHTHDGQIWPFAIFTRLIYGQYQHGLYQDGNYTLYTSSGVGAWGPPIRTGNVPEIAVITLSVK